MKKRNYFISRDAQFYGTFVRVPRHARYALTIGVACSAVGMWYVTSYRMLSSMHAASVRALDQLSQDQQKLADTQQKMEALQTNVRQLQERCAQEALLGAASGVDAQSILALVKKHGVLLQLYAPQEPVVIKDYIKQSIRIDVAGDYESLVAWMRALADLSPSLLFSYVHCEKQHDKLLLSVHIFWHEASGNMEIVDEEEL